MEKFVPHSIDSESLYDNHSPGDVKVGFSSPSADMREKLDIVKLLVKHKASTFFFRVGGVSIADSGMSEGDIVIVDRAVDPYDGCKAVCYIDGEYAVKRVEIAGKKVSLFSNRGAVFAFDVNTVYKHQEVLGNNCFVYESGKTFCAWQNSLDKDGLTVDISLDFFEEEDGAYYRSSESFTEKAYELSDIRLWLEECGFEVVGIYDDMTTDDVKPDSERAVFLARKK